MIAVMTFINYLLFIRNKRIEKINEYYQNRNLKAWKGDLIFFSYILLLFSLMAIETFISVEISKNREIFQPSMSSTKIKSLRDTSAVFSLGK